VDGSTRCGKAYDFQLGSIGAAARRARDAYLLA
jgi:hypothetical protein